MLKCWLDAFNFACLLCNLVPHCKHLCFQILQLLFFSHSHFSLLLGFWGQGVLSFLSSSILSTLYMHSTTIKCIWIFRFLLNRLFLDVFQIIIIIQFFIFFIHWIFLLNFIWLLRSSCTSLWVSLPLSLSKSVLLALSLILLSSLLCILSFTDILESNTLKIHFSLLLAILPPQFFFLNHPFSWSGTCTHPLVIIVLLTFAKRSWDKLLILWRLILA